MKVTNGEIYGGKEAIVKLLQMTLPVRASYQIAKLATKMSQHLLLIDQVRNGLIKTYGKEENGQITIEQGTENYAKFIVELNELFQKEVEMEIGTVDLPTMVMEKCEKCEAVIEKPLQIEPTVLMALDKFVEIE